MPQGTAPDSLKYTNLYEESRRITEAKEKQEKRLLIGMFKAFACHIFPNHVIVVQEDKDRLSVTPTAVAEDEPMLGEARTRPPSTSGLPSTSSVPACGPSFLGTSA